MCIPSPPDSPPSYTLLSIYFSPLNQVGLHQTVTWRIERKDSCFGDGDLHFSNCFSSPPSYFPYIITPSASHSVSYCFRSLPQPLPILFYHFPPFLSLLIFISTSSLLFPIFHFPSSILVLEEDQTLPLPASLRTTITILTTITIIITTTRRHRVRQTDREGGS